ncbi:MAG: response regulator transcription factor [Clostridia bacterium]|nr:response regulator transcription factor [Clostridia bacterium]
MVSDNKNNTYEDEKKMILAVDDEEAIIDLLKFNIEKEGYKFISATNGDEGFELAMGERPDLIILDVMLPRMDGLSVCQKLRQEKNTVPVIMLSARSEEIDKILGLEIGADDYMTKPFSTRELIARIKANLRKNDKMAVDVDDVPEGRIVIGSLSLDPEKFEVVVRGRNVTDLTRREFEVLKYLAQKPGQVVSREDLLERVWGYEYFGDIRTVDVTVRRIREKIERNTSNPKILITKRGIGYYIAKP